jgi:glycosyltransferase involved in cell wall biosynthesis
MPCYNSATVIAEAIDSVLDQTFQDWELLICDDSSSDGSVNIIKQYSALDSRIILIENSCGKGAAGARNSSLKAANGRYIAFLDSDDKWCTNKLELQVLAMKTGAVFSFSSYYVMSEVGNILGVVSAPSFIKRRRMLFANFIGCVTAMYDSEYFGKVSQPMIEKRNDYALWLTMLAAKECANLYSISVPLAYYRTNSYGLSSNKLDAVRYYWICIRTYASVGRFKASGLLFVYFIIIFLKKMSPTFYNSLVSMLMGNRPLLQGSKK